MSTPLSSIPDPSRRRRPRGTNLTVVWTADQYAVLRAAADAAGISISSLIRRALVHAGVLSTTTEAAAE